MSVRLEVSIFVADAPLLPPQRSQVISSLFAASEPWLTRPEEVLVLDLAPGAQERQSALWDGDGNAPALVDAPLGGSKLLFVYSRESTTDPPQSSPPRVVSVEEDSERRQAVYALSVPMPAREQTDDVEGWLRRLCGVVAAWRSECILAFRDEDGLTCGRTAGETLEYALGPLNAGWVVAPDHLVRALPVPPRDELLEAVGGGAVLVRRFSPLF